MGARVLVIIPAFKRPDQLEKCLAALSASDYPVDTFVHDNSETNVYFTKAINIGLRQAFDRQYDFALALNQDCYVEPACVGALVDLMQRRPRCGIAGLKQISTANADWIIHAGCLEAFPAGRHVVGLVSKGEHTADRPMPWINGAAMFARMSAVREFGMLDENMLLLGSDSDWCYTARARGWEVWYAAGAVCKHEQEGVSRSQPSPALATIMARDMGWWRDKWIGQGVYSRLMQQPVAYDSGLPVSIELTGTQPITS